MLLALVIAGALSQAAPIDTFGKTNAEILRMGGARWADYYTSKTTQSTADTNQAWEIYGELASERNAKEIERLSPTKRKQLKLLDQLLNAYGSAVIDVGRGVSGGGTLWSTLFDVGVADAEDAIYFVLHPSLKRAPKPAVISQVARQLQKLSAAVGKMDKPTPPMPSKLDLTKEIAKSRELYGRITAIASTLPRSASDRILGFCFEQTQTAIDQAQ